MQALYIGLLNPSKRKDLKGEWSFEVLAPNRQKVGIEMVKCYKHSRLVFSICDAYLYKVKAQLDRTAYRSRHGTDN